ncbi:hypothetical protein Tco_1565449 [Tanacetum coccineum]
MTHPHPNRKFLPQALLTRSGKINTAGASVNTAVRPLNIAGLKTIVNHSRPISNAYKKGYSQVTRPFNKYSANKNSIFNKKVNTVRVKDITARDRVVVSENKRKGDNIVKALVCWVWKAKNSSASNTFKKYSYIDARGRSKHMTGNKCYLTEYEDYDGGFVSFGDGKGTRDNIVAGPKDSEEDVGMKPTELKEIEACDKGEDDEQDTRCKFERLLQQEKQTNSTNSFNTVGIPVSVVGPSFTNDNLSSPVNAAEASNAFEDHLFE